MPQHMTRQFFIITVSCANGNVYRAFRGRKASVSVTSSRQALNDKPAEITYRRIERNNGESMMCVIAAQFDGFDRFDCYELGHSRNLRCLCACGVTKANIIYAIELDNT